ncbi:prepilin peptidase [Pigmentiphaga litoralis]|nr:prepilin peptidase [Pigmentiphaga litoralis]
MLCTLVLIGDLSVRKVFNVLVVLGLVVQGSFLALSDGGIGRLATELEPAVTGLVVGFVLLLPLYAFRAMGAGDVKFFAVVGWWMGPAALLPVFVIASLMAAGHAMALGFASSIWGVAAKDVGERLAAVLPMPAAWRFASDTPRRRQRRGIPYAAYMAVGTVGMLVWQS